jgi:hypothetical protein
VSHLGENQVRVVRGPCQDCVPDHVSAGSVVASARSGAGRSSLGHLEPAIAKEGPVEVQLEMLYYLRLTYVFSRSVAAVA